MLELIVILKALSIFSKDDAHYSFKGIYFKSLHEWVDEINGPLQGFIDEIKENYFLARDIDLPRGTEINDMAKKYIPENIGTNDDIIRSLHALLNMVNNRTKIDDESLTAGDQDMLGRISTHVQHHNALMNLAMEKPKAKEDAKKD